jgi:phenacrylate decarboxylase
LRKDGDLTEIDEEVDPNLKIAAITRRVYERRAKAPLFKNVKGMQNDLFRIMGASSSLSKDPKYAYHRLARHLGIKSDATLKDVVYSMLSAKSKRPISPVHVKTGQCKEVKITGDDIDLTRLSVPLLNKVDGVNTFKHSASILSSTQLSYGQVGPLPVP